MERFVRCIHKMKCYLFSKRFRGCRKTLCMLQITSVVSKVVESVDCCQPIMCLPDGHTKSSLPTLKTPLIVIPSSLCELLPAPMEVTGENQVHNIGGHWPVLKSWKSQILHFIWFPVLWEIQVVQVLWVQKLRTSHCSSSDYKHRNFFFPFWVGEVRSWLWIMHGCSNSCIELNH